MQQKAHKQDQRIHICIITPSLECGGSERNVSILCNGINPENFRVSLIVINNSRPFYIIDNPGVKLIDLKLAHVRQSLFRIRSFIRKNKPDIVLSASNHLNLLLAIFRWLFPSGIPIIARESSVVSVNSKRAKWPILYEWLLKRFYRSLNLIVCQSEYMQKDLQAHYHVPASKTTIMYNALQVPRADNMNQTGNSEANLLTVARLSPEKGIDRIIHALALLKRPFIYTVVGDGGERSKLETLVKSLGLKDRVRFTGSKDHPFNLNERPDVFLLGSYYEGFPNVVIEAMSLGIPAVAYDCPGGLREVLVAGENGFIAGGQEPADMAASIEKALAHPFNRQRIADETRERYDAKQAVLQWEKLFHEYSGNK